MNRKPLVIALIIPSLLVTALVRLAAMRVVDCPGIGDPNYYQDVASAFARGDGLTTRCAWNLMHLPELLPGPGCDYWGPGVPLIAGLAYRALGPELVHGQWAMGLCALALTVLAVLLAARLATRSSAPLWVGLLMAVHSQLTFFSVTIDTPIPFAVAVNASLLPLGLAHATGWSAGWLLAVPGALAAQLVRADGMLVPLTLFAFALHAVWRGRLSRGRFGLMALVYLVGWSVWLARNASAFGKPLPSSITEGLFLVDYNDLFRIHTKPTLARYLALGWQQILTDKWSALVDNLRTVAFGENALLLAVAAMGLPTLVRKPVAHPFLAYFALLFLAMTFAFNHQSKFGSLLHSVPALFPLLATCALIGVERALEGIAEWPKGRRRWLFRTALTLLPSLLVMFSGLQVLVWVTRPEGLAHPFGQLAAMRRELAGWWARPGVGGPDVRVMSNDSLDLLGCLPAPVVQEPRDPGLDAVFELARRYRLKYFVVFRVPRYKTGAWDQPRYAHPTGELVHVGDLPARLAEIELDGIALYEFRLH